MKRGGGVDFPWRFFNRAESDVLVPRPWTLDAEPRDGEAFDPDRCQTCGLDAEWCKRMEAS